MIARRALRLLSGVSTVKLIIDNKSPLIRPFLPVHGYLSIFALPDAAPNIRIWFLDRHLTMCFGFSGFSTSFCEIYYAYLTGSSRRLDPPTSVLCLRVTSDDLNSSVLSKLQIIW